MKMAQRLGKPVSEMLVVAPFNTWRAERSVQDAGDEVRVYYVFKDLSNKRCLEVLCDLDERVRTIFLKAEECHGVSLSEIPFSSTRKNVLESLGAPAQSGEGIQDPRLGTYGGWDRFTRPGYALHVEYRPDADGIRRITLMREDAVP